MWYDLIVIAILLFAAFRGLQRGVIYQIATIASVVLCFIFAEAISAAVAPAIPLDPPLNNWVVMVGAYVFFSFVAFGFARVLDGWVEKAKMKEFNRFLGGSFGLAKGLLFCLVLTFFAVTMSEKARVALKDSKSAKYAAIIMDRLHTIPGMPEKLQVALDRYLAYFEGYDHAGDHNHTFANEDDKIFGDIGLPDLGAPTTTPPANNGGNWNPFSGGSDPTFSNTSNSNGLPTMAPPSTSNPFGNGSSSTGLPNNGFGSGSNPMDVDGIIDRLPWTLSNEMERVVRMALERATPQERVAMEQQLSSAAPQMITDLARGWLSGEKPQGSGTTQPASPTRDFFGNAAGGLYDRATGTTPQQGTSNPTRDMVKDLAGNWLEQQLGNRQAAPNQPVTNPNTLISNIARMYSRDATEQAANEQSIRQQLQGLSQPAAAAVLADWSADLLGQGVDPNPATGRNTDLQTRIRYATQRVGGTPSSGSSY